MQQQAIKDIVIVGGGTAGWLTAGILAAEHNIDNGHFAPTPRINITLIESPDIPTIGVGEGTWPSMRSTLQKIGLSETEFMRAADASFKQGSQFIDWCVAANETASHFAPKQYYHPFSLPMGEPQFSLAPFWLAYQDKVHFADAVSQQAMVSDNHLAPKQIGTKEYSFINNYGYHLDAGKFTELLKRHCVEKLHIRFIQDNVVEVLQRGQTNEQDDTFSQDIIAVNTQNHGHIKGDLFIDCTGSNALLIDKTLNVPFIEQKSVLFNDSAMALQIPYPEADAPIKSCTRSTAVKLGWIWEIGLPTRIGIGHVYASDYCDDDTAKKTLNDYALGINPKLTADELMPRKIRFNPGHRQVCWQNNCVAVGMAAGFIEPLEASALTLIEWTAKAIAAQLPANRQVMDIAAKRVNQLFLLHWQQIIEFLKLHYVLSKRTDSDYWLAHKDESSIPPSLQAQLQQWQHQVPASFDIAHKESLFPAASFQYVLYGMGFNTTPHQLLKPSMQQQAQEYFQENQQRIKVLMTTLPTNRALLTKLTEQGFAQI